MPKKRPLLPMQALYRAREGFGLIMAAPVVFGYACFLLYEAVTTPNVDVIKLILGCIGIIVAAPMFRAGLKIVRVDRD